MTSPVKSFETLVRELTRRFGLIPNIVLRTAISSERSELELVEGDKVVARLVVHHVTQAPAVRPEQRALPGVPLSTTATAPPPVPTQPTGRERALDRWEVFVPLAVWQEKGTRKLLLAAKGQELEGKWHPRVAHYVTDVAGIVASKLHRIGLRHSVPMQLVRLREGTTLTAERVTVWGDETETVDVYVHHPGDPRAAVPWAEWTDVVGGASWHAVISQRDVPRMEEHLTGAGIKSIVDGFLVPPQDVEEEEASRGKTKRAKKPAGTRRVWIRESDWDELDGATQAALTEPVKGSSIEWEGREGAITAVLPEGALIDSLADLAQSLDLALFWGEAPPPPPEVKAAATAAVVAKIGGGP